MPRQSQYVTGWIDTTIHDFLSEIDEVPSNMTYVLVTCLDSSFDIASLLSESRRLRGLREQCKPVGDGALLTTRRLLAAERLQRIFFGFDELWFLPDPQVDPKPPDLVITGPHRIDAQHLARLTEWMRANCCSLGLGDGTGMNFCARLRGVARNLVRAFSEAQRTMYDKNQKTA